MYISHLADHSCSSHPCWQSSVFVKEILPQTKADRVHFPAFPSLTQFIQPLLSTSPTCLTIPTPLTWIVSVYVKEILHQQQNLIVCIFQHFQQHAHNLDWAHFPRVWHIAIVSLCQGNSTLPTKCDCVHFTTFPALTQLSVCSPSSHITLLSLYERSFTSRTEPDHVHFPVVSRVPHKEVWFDAGAVWGEPSRQLPAVWRGAVPGGPHEGGRGVFVKVRVLGLFVVQGLVCCQEDYAGGGVALLWGE